MGRIHKKNTQVQKILNNQKNGLYPTQKSEEWYQARYNIITASDCASALNCNPYESSHELLIRKISGSPGSPGSPNMEWGNKYEPIARDFYSTLTGLQIHEVGLITHPTHTWLGASPDGIYQTKNGKGKLLEIKCPAHRKIGNIPHFYWIQTQIQLEVCNIDECDFLDCEFEECSEEQHNLITKPSSEKGIIPTYWYLKKYLITTIKKDTTWIQNNINDLKTFWHRIIYYREKGLHQLHADATLAKPIEKTNVKPGSKRKCQPTPNDPLGPNTKHQKINHLIDWKKWIPATQTRNYIIEDPLIDWLEYNIKNLKPTFTNPLLTIPTSQAEFDSDLQTSMLFTNFLKENGTTFEKQVMKKLFKKFPTQSTITTIANQYQARCPKKHKETIEAMRIGTPIIYHGVLHNPTNRTYGMPDLIVRSDWLNKIFTEPVISDTNSKTPARSLSNSKNPNPWHYRIIDIKFTTMNLRADGLHLLKTNNVEAMKAQLYIYNTALSNIQGYKAPCAYILGRKWQFKKQNIIYSGNGCLDRAGHINYKKADRHIRKKTRDALLWIHKVRRHGHKFTINPPSHPELYPNMNNTQDGPWRRIKSKIASNIGEITLLWNCGPKNRRIAHSNGIYNWKNSKCRAELLGVTGHQNISTLQSILDVNQDYTNNTDPFAKEDKETAADQDESGEICEETHKETTRVYSTRATILPEKIDCHTFASLKKSATYPVRNKILFVDFETITQLTMDESLGDSAYLFMIGIGYLETDQNNAACKQPLTSGDLSKWKYKCFHANKLTSNEELRIFIEFHRFISEFSTNDNNAELVHWSHAERTVYNSVWIKHENEMKRASMTKINSWVDLLKIFKEEPITIRGALNFSLKNVAKAFFSHGFISTTWEGGDVFDGLTAMIQAYRAYKTTEENNISEIMRMPIMREIMRYNEVDVKVMCEILFYLFSTT